MRRRHFLIRALHIAAGVGIAGRVAAQLPSSDPPPPNLVAISERLVTSGQPSAAWLRTLKAQGFGAVVYLAPPTVSDAVKDEAVIVASQGLAYVNIPIDFDAPAERDLTLFSNVLRGLADRKVLVHCQINLRASSMVFLHRAIALREDPERAYDAVSRVWKPEGPWRRFIEAQLKAGGLAFRPY